MAPIATQRAEYSILKLEPPGGDPINIGVLLLDPGSDRLFARLRRDWESFAPAEELQVLRVLENHLFAESSQTGGTEVLSRFENTLSNFLCISDRRETVVEDFDRALNRLYRQNVFSNVHEFRTHLPRYSLAVAAGPFLENREIETEEWVEAPANLRLSEGMFVAQVRGHSMEPLIPDGSLCIFRRNVTGSREGLLVLVESLGGGVNDRYTVKRYRSNKIQDSTGGWTHQRIRLEPLNPEFQAWDLDPEEGRYRILAEFVQPLD